MIWKVRYIEKIILELKKFFIRRKECPYETRISAQFKIVSKQLVELFSKLLPSTWLFVETSHHALVFYIFLCWPFCSVFCNLCVNFVVRMCSLIGTKRFNEKCNLKPHSHIFRISCQSLLARQLKPRKFVFIVTDQSAFIRLQTYL